MKENGPLIRIATLFYVRMYKFSHTPFLSEGFMVN